MGTRRTGPVRLALLVCVCVYVCVVCACVFVCVSLVCMCPTCMSTVCACHDLQVRVYSFPVCESVYDCASRAVYVPQTTCTPTFDLRVLVRVCLPLLTILCPAVWPMEYSSYWNQGWGSGILSAIAANSSFAFYSQLFDDLLEQVCVVSVLLCCILFCLPSFAPSSLSRFHDAFGA